MSYIYNAKILNVRPSTGDEGDIIDAYIEVEVNDAKIWCFVPRWRTYFPYGMDRPHHPYGVGETLIKNIIGKVHSVEFNFINFPEEETRISEKKEKKITPKDPNVPGCDHYTIIGKVINKVPFPNENENFEYLQVNCGFVVNKLTAKKGRFKLCDYIQAEGRLDAYIVDEKQKLNIKLGDDDK